VVPIRHDTARLADAHIDIYASCGGPGTFAILGTIFYTVP